MTVETEVLLKTFLCENSLFYLYSVHHFRRTISSTENVSQLGFYSTAGNRHSTLKATCFCRQDDASHGNYVTFIRFFPALYLIQVNIYWTRTRDTLMTLGLLQEDLRITPETLDFNQEITRSLICPKAFFKICTASSWVHHRGCVH